MRIMPAHQTDNLLYHITPQVDLLLEYGALAFWFGRLP